MEKKPGGSDDKQRAPTLKKDEAAGSKATQFDGNPNPEGAESNVPGPKDDTPLTLEKKEGPKR